MRRLLILAGVIVAAVVVCTGGTAAHTTGGLRGALDSIGAGPASRAYVEWGDIATWRRLLGIPRGWEQASKSGAFRSAAARFLPLLGFGGGRLTDVAAQLAPLGLDVLAADSALTVGRPPHDAIRLDGVDGKKIRRSLETLGAKPKKGVGGRTFLAIGKEGSLVLTGKLGRLGILDLLDRAVIESSRVAVGGFEAPIATALGDGGSLGRDADHASLVGCLGDVVVAQIGSGQVFRLPPALRLVGIALRTPMSKTGPLDEVICLLAASPAEAGKTAQLLRRGLHGTSSVTHRPWSVVFARVRVDTVTTGGRALVRAVLRLAGTAPTTAAFQMAMSGDLQALLGA